MMMGRENYSLKYVNEKIKSGSVERGGGGTGVFKHNLKILKEGQSLFCLCYGFFSFSLFSFFLFFGPMQRLRSLELTAVQLKVFDFWLI